MKLIFLIFSALILSINLYAIDIDEKSSGLEILSKSHIYLDKTNSLSKNEIVTKEFQENTLESLNLGISPNTALWIKFRLKNSTDKKLHKILEYNNPETENLFLYYDDITIDDGMFHHKLDRETLNPIFDIELEAHEEKTFYIKAHCKISTLIAELIIWNKVDFIKSSTQHLYFLFIFFAVLSTLLIYNLMLFIFTKQLVYFYYILYLGGVIFFESIYLGVAQLYLFSNEISIFITKGTIGYITILVIPMILFTMEFLNTKKFKQVHSFMKFYLYLLPLVSILSFDNFLFDLNIMLIYFPLAFVMVYAGFFAYKNGQKEAVYYLLGWSFIIISLLLSVWKSLGGYDVFLHFAYINELAFTLEALLFSIALAHRINALSEQKEIANNRLIEFQQNEQHRLKQEVDERTKELQNAVDEKDILYRELNHRIKNNIQMVLSLIKLQLSNSNSKKVKDALIITKNRISSVANLYEVLYLKNSTKKFDTQIYFENIITNMRENLTQEINIEYQVDYNIHTNNLIYCGIILNELATNSFKYANCKELAIYIYKEDKYVYMIVKDDGKGFKQDKASSLGLTIIETLVKKQLHGEIDIRSVAGTMTTIKWSENE